MQWHSQGTSGAIFHLVFSSPAFLTIVIYYKLSFGKKPSPEDLRGFLLKDSWVFVKNLFSLSLSKP
jgi:hypothetical protein